MSQICKSLGPLGRRKFLALSWKRYGLLGCIGVHPEAFELGKD